MAVTLYGIKTCDTCRKAAKELGASGTEVVFHDVRADPLGTDQIAKFLQAFGDALLNKKSTTWRGLDDAARAAAPLALLAEHPTLMKRPVIEGPGGLTLGWTAEAKAAHLAG